MHFSPLLFRILVLPNLASAKISGARVNFYGFVLSRICLQHLSTGDFL